ncbi:hypothetical protein Pla108_10040 [Botrimarina colliarenosi]|uniref:Uncharacterized protein n=1 Tax=Botrimarina colliarenosi TaxID=2528001 RepID=A0A5C6AK79_9BACT|nr:hypothetical protein [Botrimarina colliarenosi]TWU00060.1 hypothetical protein Pla108_10040 [Botrimarina colliarenosi]
MLAPKQKIDPVDCLLRNAELRDQLDPLFDESIDVVDVGRMSTPHENDFLESMLAWERAPMLPIGQWFDPPLVLPEPDRLEADEISRLLTQTVETLFTKNVVLDFTDHLSDRQLYTLVARDILPAFEKKLDRQGTYLHWDCANLGEDAEAWLRYYASPEERDMWQEETGEDLPPASEAPFVRKLPKAPM